MGKSPEKKKDEALVPEVVEPVLSRRHEAVVVALIANPTIKEAAAKAGVSESTVWRLMQREDFQRRYREAQDKAFDGALGALQAAGTEAIDSLKRNLTCGTPAAEEEAAKAILDFTLKVREQIDHDRRLRQLEEALRAREEADARRAAGGGAEDED
jgi:DNA-binding MurR/RpiR family transcriptional regulator